MNFTYEYEIYILSALLLIGLSFNVFADPKERYSNQNIVEAIAFADRISGTSWVYSWRGNDYTFRFNENGGIGILESWDNVNWVVTGNREVVLEGGKHKMLLSFNEYKNAFYTRDWDGMKSDGRLLK